MPPPSQAKRNQPVVGLVRPVACQPLQIGEHDALVVRHSLGRAVGEARAEPRFPQCTQILLEVGGRTDVVTPIVDEGDAAVDRFGRREPCALIHIGGLVFLPERRGGAEVAQLGLFTRHAAKQRIPHMPVGFDQSGQHDHADAIDRRRAGCVELLADGHDHAVLHMNVAVLDVGRSGLHGHHIGVADDHVAARWQLGRGRRRGECRRRMESRQSKRAERDTIPQDAAAADV